MGYHGYAPGKYAPTRPTEVQAALRLITKQDTFELLSKIIRNVVPLPTSCMHKTLHLKHALLFMILQNHQPGTSMS